MNRRILLLSAASAAVVAGGYGFLNRSASTGPSPLVTGFAHAQEGDVDTSEIREMSMGNPDADVTVIEYASFTCPHCRTFHETTFELLKQNYIDPGRIHFIYREVYFDRFGLWAAMLARCAGPERYFGMTELLYETQQEWTAGGDPAAVAENLRKLGRTAGLSDEEVNACLQDGDKARAMVALYQQNAEADDISSTPSFVINGEKYSNMNYADFSAVLDEKLGS